MRDFALAAMAHRLRVKNLLLGTFEQWGYALVETPLLEYTDVFAQGVHEGEEEHMYRLFDAFGHTLALRPEMTTPVARLAATVLGEERVPLRLCYSAKTYREPGQRAREAAEVTQVGIELLGAGSADADAEVVALMVSSLRSLGLTAFRIALGHVGYVRALLATADAALTDALTGALMERDIVAYERALLAAKGTLSAQDAAAFYELPRMRGGENALVRTRAMANTPAARAACADLEDLYIALAAHGVQQWVTFDMTLYPHHEYYSGVVIEGYVEQMGQRICYGGRYDELLTRFGRPLAATGCVLHLERLQDVVPPQPSDRSAVQLLYESGTRVAALGFARELRGRGYVVSATGRPEARDGSVPCEAACDVRFGEIIGEPAELRGDALLAQMFQQYCEQEGI